MVSHHLERCADLRQWRLSHAGELPKRRSDNQKETSLAMWLSKALPRRFRSLGDGPSKKQLTPEETSHLNSILQEEFHAGVDSPGTDSGSNQSHAPKPPLTSGDLDPAARSLKRARKDEVLPKDPHMSATPSGRETLLSTSQSEVRKPVKPRPDLSRTTHRAELPIRDHCAELPTRSTRVAAETARDAGGLEHARCTSPRRLKMQKKFDLEHAFAETHVRLKNFNPEKRMMMRVIDHACSSTSCISHRVADMMRSLDWYVTADLSPHQPLDACGSVQLMFAIPDNVVAPVVRGAHNFLDSAEPGLGWTLGRP